VGDVADGLADGVRGVGNGMVSAAKGAGSQIMGALDKPFTKFTGKEGPHRIIDRFLNGTVDAGVNVVDVGGLRSIQDEGNAIMRAMDQPLEQISSFTKRK